MSTEDPANKPKPFKGRGQWLDRPWDDSKLTLAERCERVDSYLREAGLSLPRSFIEVLAYCNVASTIQFLYPIITMSGWQRVGQRTLSNGIYRITTRAWVAGHSVDILLEDMLRHIICVFEIDHKKEFLPGKIQAVQRVRSEIRSKVNRYYLVPALAARKFGQDLRRDLMKEQIQRAQLQSPVPAPVKNRYWHGATAYNVSGLSPELRRECIDQWLSAKGILLPEPFCEVLAECDRAAELDFILQLVGLPRTSAENGSLVISEFYRITPQVTLGSGRVDFLIEPISPHASRSRYVIEINPPHHHQQDRRLLLARDNELFDLGYLVERVEAHAAKSAGHKWAEVVINDSVRQAAS